MTDTRIVDYSSAYGDAFDRLNREWLEEFFYVEPIDAEIMGDPQRHIIDHGGLIIYALKGDTPVGTVALKQHGEAGYELTKMAVARACQGEGIGRQLLCAAIARFEELDGNRLYLESHSSLGPALALYESADFCHETPPAPSEYQRADVYMVYRPQQAGD